MGHVTVNGTRWYYELTGPEDAPVVALGNGIFADARNWAPLAARLAKRLRVLCFDFPGQGRSDALDRPVSVEAQARGLSALLETLGLERVHYLGVSYGAEVGLSWALDAPHQVQRLIAADCVAWVHPALAQRAEAWLAAIRGGDAELFYTVAAPDIFSPGFVAANPALMDRVREGFRALDLTAMEGLLSGYGDFDLRERLSELSAPTLFLCGALDTLKPPALMAELQRAVPGAEFLTLPGAGHAAHMEAPEAFLTAAWGFLTKEGSS